MDRVEMNGGIIPDNVGPTSRIGEFREGVWWGGLFGWNSYLGWKPVLQAVAVGSECCHVGGALCLPHIILMRIYLNPVASTPSPPKIFGFVKVVQPAVTFA